MNNYSSIDPRINLYHIIEQTPKDNLKKLNQVERKTVLIALQSLKSSKQEYVQQDYQGIINKLIEIPKAETTNFSLKEWINQGLKRLFWKIDGIGVEILSQFGCAISANQLLIEYNRVSSQMNQLKRLPDLIARKNENLVALQELSRFQTEDALPLYRDIQEFYDHLPNKMSEAEPLLEQKIARVKEQIKQARVENKDKGYVHILEKEILDSLTKLKDFQLKNLKSHILKARETVLKNKVKTFKNEDNLKILADIQSKFDNELGLTRKVWRRVADECDSQGYTKKAIDETKEQIANLQEELEQLRQESINLLIP